VEVLVVDGANVVGSRPDGWWRDRPGAASRLHEQLAAAELPTDEVVLVLEGAARRGRPPGQEGRVRTLHAAGSGDDAIVEEVCRQVAVRDGRTVVVVTADRLLRDRVEQAGGRCRGPGWLLEQL
jgi:predicted RNA-binding protein with PIN domain